MSVAVEEVRDTRPEHYEAGFAQTLHDAEISPGGIERDRSYPSYPMSVDDAFAPQLIRAGALLVLGFQLFYLAEDLHQFPRLAATTVPFHGLNILIGAAVLAVTWTAWFSRYWRSTVWTLCCTLLASTTAISIANGQIEPLFVSIILLLIGAATLVPWSASWQVGLELAGVGSFAAGRFGAPLSPYHWLGLITVIALAHFWNTVGRSNRAELSRGVQALRENEVRLEQKVIELDHAERRARQSQATIRRMFDATSETIIVSKLPDGTILDVNPEFTRQTGYTKEAALGASTLDLRLWVDLATRAKFISQIQSTGKIRELETRLRTKDGTEVPVLISAARIELDGEACVVSMMRDITVLKDATKKLLESQDAFREIIESSPDPITINRLSDGRYMQLGREFAVAEYSRDEALGKTPEELNLWNDRRELKHFMETLRRKGLVRNMEVSFRTKSGDLTPCLISATIIEIGGEPCIVSFVRDVTIMKRAETRLRQSEATLRVVIEAIPDPITINALSDGRYIAINNAWAQATGYNREDALGRPVTDLWADPGQMREFLRRLRTDSAVLNMEMGLRNKDGGVSPNLVSAVLADIDGEQSIISITRDITALKNTENELRAAREAALAAGRAKSEFLSSMSHEIRTPMNAILGMTDILWENSPTQEQRRYLSIMRSNSDALLNLINDILDLAKIESGRLQMETTDLKLDELIDKVAEMMAIRAHEKGLELSVRVAPDVPVHLIGDPLRLRQILINLVGNAVKFTETGGIVLSVDRATPDAAAAQPHGASDGLRLRFSVRDTGVGIPSDKLGMLFSSFTQADSSTTRKYGGSGLGLAIVKRLVELHGGEIYVESEPGRGSCFSFTAQFGAGSADSPARPSSAIDLSGVRTLVVDDTAVNRLIIREILAKESAEVSECESGAEALAELERAKCSGTPYRLLVLDGRMPGMDGIEVLRRLRELDKDGVGYRVVVVMLTSDDLGAQVASLREVGVESYLVKPVRRSELLATVARALGAQGPSTRGAEVSPADTVSVSPLRILLADDSEDNRLLIRAYLKKTACELVEAEDGAAALQRFKEGKYDVVLMDMRMPVVDGDTATRAIRAWERAEKLPRTPVIALTASALVEDVRRCLAAGCDLHVAKPVKRTTLVSAIYQLVNPDASYAA
ncbi:MAG TPA: PAS domain S-box protein [Candidatus Binataceae bacterium]|nr:PAS domain S-box protein [Candidatus Binataceae bacterium]